MKAFGLLAHYMDSAAIEALEKWRFQPHLLDGKPVEVNYTFWLKLSLGG